jgi:hypothetical protein
MESLSPSDSQASAATSGVTSPDGDDALKCAIAAMQGDHSGLAARIRTLQPACTSGHTRTRVRVHYLALMAVGLSRMAASKILPKIPSNLEAVDDVRQWLLSVDPVTFDLPPILQAEVLRALGVQTTGASRQAST